MVAILSLAGHGLPDGSGRAAPVAGVADRSLGLSKLPVRPVETAIAPATRARGDLPTSEGSGKV